MNPEHSRPDTLDMLLETVQRIRSDEFPHVPASLVKSILEIEVRHEENEDLALSEIEQAVSKAAKGKLGEVGGA